MKHRIFSILTLMGMLLVSLAPLAAQEKTECEDSFRLIVHRMGEMCVPETAQRIVVLGPASFEFAYLAGKTIVGAPGWTIGEMVYVSPHLESTFSNVVDIGFPPNPEVILDLQPDLIIGHEEESIIAAYEELEAIAPTIIQSDETNRNWEVAAEFWSSVLGGETIFTEMKATYDVRITALNEILSENAADLEVSVLVASSPEFTFAWLPNTGIGKILDDAGISRPESQREPSEMGVVPISQETLNLADGDVIFIFGYPYTDAESIGQQEEYLEGLIENPLWQTLNAVQNDQVYRVGDYWYRGIYYLATHQILDDLFIYLAGVDPAEASPNPFSTVEATPEATAEASD
jgi:iron complex transport system substrate-binding protein